MQPHRIALGGVCTNIAQPSRLGCVAQQRDTTVWAARLDGLWIN